MKQEEKQKQGRMKKSRRRLTFVTQGEAAPRGTVVGTVQSEFGRKRQKKWKEEKAEGAAAIGVYMGGLEVTAATLGEATTPDSEAEG